MNLEGIKVISTTLEDLNVTLIPDLLNQISN